MLFRDRFVAGQILAKHLAHYRHRPDVLVLALPRGGVPVLPGAGEPYAVGSGCSASSRVFR